MEENIQRPTSDIEGPMRDRLRAIHRMLNIECSKFDVE